MAERLTAGDGAADRVTLNDVRDGLREAAKLIAMAQKVHGWTGEALERAIEQRHNSPVRPSFEHEITTCNHRREHRPGRPAKIDADSELKAFICARIDHLTFIEIADAVADAFPPARRVGKSAIHAWWKRHLK